MQSGNKGKLEKIDGKMMMSEVILEPHVVIDNEQDRDRADRILQKSEAACLITNSVKSKVMMQPVIEVLQTQH